MPKTDIVFFQDAEGRAPVREWLDAFVGRNVAILLHALTKEGSVPDTEVARAVERWQLAKTDPRTHIREDLA